MGGGNLGWQKCLKSPDNRFARSNQARILRLFGYSPSFHRDQEKTNCEITIEFPDLVNMSSDPELMVALKTLFSCAISHPLM
jgi:hypothetical protein